MEVDIILILPQEAEIELGGRNIKHFEEKGYKIPKRLDRYGRLTIPKGTKIIVNVLDLQRYSQVKIKIKCDYCNNIFEVYYTNYIKQKENNLIKDDCCRKCQSIKNKKIFNLKYGTNNPMKVQEIKQKANLIILEKYKVNHISQSSEIKLKKIVTCNKNYNVDYPM